MINQAVAVCPDGKRVISGGYMHDTAALAEIFSNTPEVDSTAWVVVGINWAGLVDGEPLGEITAIAYCVPTDEEKAPYAERVAAAQAAGEQLVAKARATKKLK